MALSLAAASIGLRRARHPRPTRRSPAGSASPSCSSRSRCSTTRCCPPLEPRVGPPRRRAAAAVLRRAPVGGGARGGGRRGRPGRRTRAPRGSPATCTTAWRRSWRSSAAAPRGMAGQPDADDIVVAAERALLDSRWAIEHLARAPDEPLERVLGPPRRGDRGAHRRGRHVLHDSGSASVGPEVSDALARILGEAVTNARHGNATRRPRRAVDRSAAAAVIDDGQRVRHHGPRHGLRAGRHARARRAGRRRAERPVGPGRRDRGGRGASMTAPVAGARGRRPRADPRGRPRRRRRGPALHGRRARR